MITANGEAFYCGDAADLLSTAMPKPPSSTILPFLSVERSSEAGVANQIHASLRRAIESGVLRSGFRLPSSRELAKAAGVGRNSVIDAYERLIVEGFLRGQSGSGTYVVGPSVILRPVRTEVNLSRRAAGHALTAGARSLNRPFAAAAPAADQFPWKRWLHLVSAGWRAWRDGPPAPQETQGLPELRAAVAEHAAVICGISAQPDEVLIGTASDGLITALARLIADPGDSVLLDDGSDRASRLLFELIGLRCVEATLDVDGLDVEAARGADVRMAFLRPSREGPHGAVMSPGRRYSVMAWAKTRALPVIEDDFDAVVDPPAPGLRALKSLDTRGVCIYVADLSRSLMPGVRITFAIAPPAIVDACREARLFPSTPPPAGEQLALARLLRSGEFSREIARMRGVYQARREALAGELQNRLAGAITSVQRRGPLQLIARLSQEFHDVAVAKAAAELDLDVTPLSISSPEDNGLILGYGGTPPAQMPEIVSTLVSAFETQDRKTVLTHLGAANRS